MATRKLKSNLQSMLSHHCLSRTVAKLADCRIPVIKNFLIKLFIYYYKVDINIAASNQLSDYPTFNHFFTRALNPSARPIATESDTIVSPADGAISQAGQIKEQRLFQAKGQTFSLQELLGGDQERAFYYDKGQFATIYLAPSDYHRVHMPLDGKLLKTIYIPGTLFSVNSRSVAKVPNLFCRNERLICFFETEIGEVSLIMVGAMLVAGIETVWGKKECPCSSREKVIKDYEHSDIRLNKGSEMGRFQYGSTVILLFPSNTVQLYEFSEPQKIIMGAPLGKLLKKDEA